ncbi:response regulator transcription factor [Cryptosporangium aurantiacum]|uniref:Two component transcriptional regulator, LuxR family n=1 Tax=Cryptosporangium aurantiacum TaxID=134849 RepID=A0A1M7RF42_9ACTN|nr:response regulator transcription factor [Cryptosporangium aurantiacum]SHN44658.1 two component transcriptional regulator, LuxR family [Cryptosporangium aurantiacum]
MTDPAGLAPPGGVTVAVVDDHPTTRAGTRLLLTEAGYPVVAEAGDLAGARNILTARTTPSVLVLDLNLPDGHALQHLPALRTLAPAVPILVLSAQDDTPVIRAALAAGAAGFILKDAPAPELAAAVAEVAAGGHYVQPHLATRLARSPYPAGVPLTEREQTAIRLWAEGYTNTQVAQTLMVSVRTVESIRASLRNRLGLTDRAQIAAYARTHLR